MRGRGGGEGGKDSSKKSQTTRQTAVHRTECPLDAEYRVPHSTRPDDAAQSPHLAPIRVSTKPWVRGQEKRQESHKDDMADGGHQAPARRTEARLGGMRRRGEHVTWLTEWATPSTRLRSPNARYGCGARSPDGDATVSPSMT
jgi:hypothetical protein